MYDPALIKKKYKWKENFGTGQPPIMLSYTYMCNKIAIIYGG